MLARFTFVTFRQAAQRSMSQIDRCSDGRIGNGLPAIRRAAATSNQRRRMFNPHIVSLSFAIRIRQPGNKPVTEKADFNYVRCQPLSSPASVRPLCRPVSRQAPHAMERENRPLSRIRPRVPASLFPGISRSENDGLLYQARMTFAAHSRMPARSLFQIAITPACLIQDIGLVLVKKKAHRRFCSIWGCRHLN